MDPMTRVARMLNSKSNVSLASTDFTAPPPELCRTKSDCDQTLPKGVDSRCVLPSPELLQAPLVGGFLNGL